MNMNRNMRNRIGQVTLGGVEGKMKLKGSEEKGADKMIEVDDNKNDRG